MRVAINLKNDPFSQDVAYNVYITACILFIQGFPSMKQEGHFMDYVALTITRNPLSFFVNGKNVFDLISLSFFIVKLSENLLFRIFSA